MAAKKKGGKTAAKGAGSMMYGRAGAQADAAFGGVAAGVGSEDGDGAPAEDTGLADGSGRARMPLPEGFVSGLDGLPGLGDPEELCRALDGEPVVSVRFNPFKLNEKPEGAQVPWCRYGFYLDERPVFTLDPALHGGAYYVQEASSMFVEHVVRSVAGDGRLRILDLCAAPGGKTTLLSTLAGPESLVVANEVVRARAGVLADNVRRWGLGNVMVTNNDPSHFSEIRDFFDIALVDAPCSGEGMFRKSPAAREEWSAANVQLCAARQRRILADVWGALAPGGVLIYTTCTFNRAENEDNVEWLAREFGCEDAGVEVDPSWGVVESDAGGISAFRFYPHKIKGEGFFAAAVRKPDGKRRVKLPPARRQPFSELAKKHASATMGWFGQPEYMRPAAIGDSIYAFYSRSFGDIEALAGVLSPLYSGVFAGQMVASGLKPAHPLALFHDLLPAGANVADLDIEQSLHYLRKEELDPAFFAEGLNLVSFEGLPLGWLKRIGSRCNNMYPGELRIRNL